MTETEHMMLDIRTPEHVSVVITKEVSAPGHTHYSLWVNINEVCRLRITKIEGANFSITLPTELLLGDW